MTSFQLVCLLLIFLNAIQERQKTTWCVKFYLHDASKNAWVASKGTDESVLSDYIASKKVTFSSCE